MPSFATTMPAGTAEAFALQASTIPSFKQLQTQQDACRFLVGTFVGDETEDQKTNVSCRRIKASSTTSLDTAVTYEYRRRMSSFADGRSLSEQKTSPLTLKLKGDAHVLGSSQLQPNYSRCCDCLCERYVEVISVTRGTKTLTCCFSVVEKGTGSPQAASNITTLGFIATW